MPIREFFHLMQIVDDFDETEARYGTLFSPRVFMSKSWSDFDKRWASLSVIGPDFVFELMEPSKVDADRDSPLPKFRYRHGQHLHSLSWYVDPEDIDLLIKRMEQHGVRVITPYPAGAGGGAQPPRTFFTHPKDTFGQLEFQAISDHSHHDPHLDPAWSGAFWRDEHPLGIERMSHMTTIVADLDRAGAFYDAVMDAPPFYTETTSERRSAFVQVGTESVIELAQPTSADTRLAVDLAEHGELPHAMTFKVLDLDAVERHLVNVGIGVAERSDSSIVVEPADMSNAVIAFTTRLLPGDPRP
jgi:Glyoxalase/Bleomycin resistance protein/Dioxygenase superfamily